MSTKRLPAWLLALLSVALVVGTAWLAARQADRWMRADLLQQARLVAQAVNINHVKALTSTAADLASPDYQRLKEQLAAVRSVNPQCRFAYLMGRQAGGAVFFFVDSEPPDAKDYSPPGQVFDELSPEFLNVFAAGTEVAEGPVTDRRGVWISALVPLTDPKNGSVVAVLGMDIDALVWKWNVTAKAALPVGLLLVLLIGAGAALTATRRGNALPKPILRRLLPPLSVMVILLLAGAGALLYQQHRQRLAGDFAADVADASGDLRVALDQQAEGLASAVQPITADALMQKALRAGDTDRLLAAWQPVFENLRRETHLTHFYFLDTNRICLLRVHQPKRRGDRINRFTAREAERTGKTTSGVELGPLGTFTLRVVQPVFEGSTLIGYVELGKEIEDALQTLHTRSGNQVAVVIRKEHLNRSHWEEGMRLLGREADWDRLPHNVVIYDSQGRLPEAFAAWADQAVHGETEREIAFNGKDWRVSATPLKDASGAEVGDLLVKCNITAAKAAFARLMTLSGTAGAVLLALLLGFIYILLRRTDTGITAQLTKLRESENSIRASQLIAGLGSYDLTISTGLWNSSPVLDTVFGIDNAYERTVAGWTALLHPDDRAALMDYLQHDVLGRGQPFDKEYRIIRHSDQVERWVHGRGKIEFDAQGCPQKLLGTIQDITERKQAEIYREMGSEILQILNEPDTLQESIRRVLAIVQTRTGFAAVAIRLQDGDDFPYVAQQGFPHDFLLTENTLVERGADGAVRRGNDGKVSLACTCGLVISGKTDPANARCTPGGSFWINEPLPDVPSDQNPRLWPCGQCLQHGYASVALVPIRAKDQIVGLLQLNDRRKGCFSCAAIHQFEGIAAHIGETVLRKQAEEQIRLLLAESNQSRLALLGIIEDEARAEADRKRLATAIEQAAEIIVMTDARGLIQYVNPAFEAVTGYTRAEAIGQNSRILKSGQQGTAFYHELWQTIRSGKTWQGRFVNRKKNGALYTEEATISPVRDAAGRIINYVAVKRDITEHLSLHAQLIQSQRLESVGRLAGGVAHDFNNILQTILGNAELAVARISPADPLHAELQEIQSASRRAADLTRQLLTFASKQTITPRTLDLNDAVEGMLKMLRRLIAENIKLVWTPRSGLWPIRMDPSQIDQIMANLCVNAHDAIADVGAVHIATDNIRIDELHTAQYDDFLPGDYVLLTVSDTGCGMDKATLNNIFEPFFTTKAAGTGLGLATVYGIVRQNHGHIGVYSEPGKGTTFRIHLPRYMGADAAQHKESLAQPAPCGCETVLLVEDDTTILSMTSRMLRELGYTVLTASAPEAALHMAEEHAGEIQLVVTDVIMPGMNGGELARQLQARQANIKCLFMSGYTASLIGHHGMLEQSFHFIAKPFSRDELARKVRELLDGSQTNDEL